MSGEVRLNNNGTINRESGLVEVCAGGRWTNICAGIFFGNAEARVICRQLGHTSPESKYNKEHFSYVKLCKPRIMQSHKIHHII